MPEYLAPGVFVEEVSFRAKSIEGVSTTTTGFVGATRYGPLDIEPEIVTSLVEFERAYGGKAKLSFSDGGETDNYMWNAVRAFFEEGGKRAYVARAFTPANETRSMVMRRRTLRPAADRRPTGSIFSVRARFPAVPATPGSPSHCRLGRTGSLATSTERVAQGHGRTRYSWVGALCLGLPPAALNQLNRAWQLSEGDQSAAVDLVPLFPAPADPANDALDVRVVTVTVTVGPSRRRLADLRRRRTAARQEP